jgi:NAD(P)-dependent dehydrogenase (short-subunit alcohol dehydrogenase family)
MKRIIEQVVIVTGAARGLGREMALALAGAGVTVAGVDLLDSQNEMERTLRLAVQRGMPGDRIFPVAADVTNPESCVTAVDTAARRFGAIHGLVNNAALGMQNISPVLAKGRKRFFEVPTDSWRAVVDVNINGPFNMARAAAPLLVRQGFGRIVNVTTSYGTMQAGGFSPYGPSKAALEAATVVWAKDLDGTGVTVNALLPGGPADTRMIPDSDGIDRTHLLRPEIMGAPIVWLVTEADDSVTGERFIAANWDISLAPKEAALKAGAPAGWYSCDSMHGRD